jgi:hypothetical protein
MRGKREPQVTLLGVPRESAHREVFKRLSPGKAPAPGGSPQREGVPGSRDPFALPRVRPYSSISRAMRARWWTASPR